MALLPLLLVVTLVVAVVVGGAAAVRRSGPSAETTVVAARRHAARTSAVAVALGVGAALATASTGGTAGHRAGGLGVTVLEVVLAFGVGHTLAIVAGELTWPRPAGPMRRARLVRREPLDAAPRWLLRTGTGVLAAATVTLVTGALLAEPDGRSISRSTSTAQGLLTSTAGPFPGWFYGRPAATGLLVLSALALAALRVVAGRPAVVTEDERIERALRRASAHRVLRGAVGTALVVTGGLLLTGGHAVWSVASGHGAGAIGSAGVLVSGCGLACMLGGVVVVCARAPGVPTDAHPVPSR